MQKVLLALALALGFIGPAHSACRWQANPCQQTHLVPVDRHVIVGHRRVVRRVPVYAVQRIWVQQAPRVQLAPASCSENCAVDLPARYVACVQVGDHLEYVYETPRGRYQMTVPRISENDKIRIYPGGKIEWVPG